MIQIEGKKISIQAERQLMIAQEIPKHEDILLASN